MTFGRLKKGTFVGRNDSHFNGIKVGDRLRNIKTQEVGHVDTYCRLNIPGKEPIKVAHWEGSDWEIIGDEVELTAVETPEEEAEVQDDCTTADAIALEEAKKRIKDLKAEVAKWKKLYDEITIDQFSDQAIADELRRRGFELTCTKTVVVTL